MNDDNSLDLLDLDDNGAMDTLPDATPFAGWLLSCWQLMLSFVRLVMNLRLR